MAVPIPTHHPSVHTAYTGSSHNPARSSDKTMEQLSEILNNHIHLLSAHQTLIRDFAAYLTPSFTSTSSAFASLSQTTSPQSARPHLSSSPHKNFGADVQLLTTIYQRAQTVHTDALACQRLLQTRVRREKLERKARELRDKVDGGGDRSGVCMDADGRGMKRRHSSNTMKMDVDVDEVVEQPPPNSRVHPIKRLRVDHPPTARSYLPHANTSPSDNNTATTPTSAVPTTTTPQPQPHQPATPAPHSAQPPFPSSKGLLYYDDLTPLVDARLAKLEKLRHDPSALNASGKKRAARFSSGGGGGDSGDGVGGEMGSFMDGGGGKRRRIGVV